MTDKPAVVALVLALGVVAVGYNVWTYSQLFMSPKPTEVRSAEASAPMGEVTAAEGDVPPVAPGRTEMGGSELRQFMASLREAGRDPFLFGAMNDALTAEGEPASLPVVQGILRGEGRSVAFVNGRAVSEGDEIDGLVLRYIADDHVVLLRDGEEYSVRPSR